MRSEDRDAVDDFDGDPTGIEAGWSGFDEISPFGHRKFAEKAALAPFSEGMHEAAQNLLDKARRDLEDNPDRARRFIERAVDLPFDEREEHAPGVVSAYFGLYMRVADAAEPLREDDPRVVNAALQVLRSTNEIGREQLEDVLAVLLHEGWFLGHAEHEVYEAIGDRPMREQIYEVQPESREDQIAFVEAVLRTEAEFVDAFEAWMDVE